MTLSRAAHIAFGAAFFFLPLSKPLALLATASGCLLQLAAGGVLDELRGERRAAWLLPAAVLAVLPLLSPWLHDGGRITGVSYFWLAALGVYVAARRSGPVDTWVLAFLGGMLVALPWGMAARLGLPPEAPPRFATPAAAGNYILFSQFLAMGVLAAARLHRQADRPALRVACWAAALAMAAGIATSHGRTGLFILLALLPLVVSGLLPRRGGLVVGVGVALTTVALLASPAVQQRLTVITEDLRKWEAADLERNSIGYRLEMWRTAGRLVARHPIVGSGPDAFRQAWRERFDPADPRHADPLRFIEPHNMYLYYATAFGLPAVAALIALLACLLASGWRHRDSLAGGLVLGFAILVTLAGLSNTLVMGTSSLLFVVLFAGLQGGIRPGSTAG
jgi:O-antigen ligase